MHRAIMVDTGCAFVSVITNQTSWNAVEVRTSTTSEPPSPRSRDKHRCSIPNPCNGIDGVQIWPAASRTQFVPSDKRIRARFGPARKNTSTPWIADVEDSPIIAATGRTQRSDSEKKPHGCSLGTGRATKPKCFGQLTGLTTRGLLCFQVTTILLFVVTAGVVSAQLEGSVANCTNEGEMVHVPGISDNPCITCSCQDREVKCSRMKCSANEGCHMVLHEKPDDLCCEQCKGCYYKGKEHTSGSTWRDEHDPCAVHICQAGVLTSSLEQCQVTCRNPIRVPGFCCPVCRGCLVGGKQYENGDSFPAPEDSCTICTCQNGSTVCGKQACPVLNCHAQYVSTPPQACCAVCTNSRKVYDLKHRKCLFRKRVYNNRTRIKPDVCTHCRCLNGTMLCARKVCPVLDCATDEVLHGRGCCARCRRSKKKCKWHGQRYQHGVVWQSDDCTHCHCDDGTVRCQVDHCNVIPQCPVNTELTYPSGKCCPHCMDAGAVCTVFGDPHYKTFDGRIYNFQGSCNYILAQDCHNRNLSIRVSNRARMSSDYAWTKSVRIRLTDSLVYLLQHYRVKVDRKRVELPYAHHAGDYTVIQGGHSVVFKSRSGVKVVWDGDSYLEVSVPPESKNNMCGLCGNYNNDESDDFIGRDGRSHIDPDSFGRTWRIGGHKPCDAVDHNGGSHSQSLCRRSSNKRLRAEKDCGMLQSRVFSGCRSEIDVEPYYRSCLQDMCDCPKDRECFCEAVTAYARSCERAGLQVYWLTPGVCGVPKCPKGTTFNVCATACPRTCGNWMHPVTCSRPCIPACQCPPGRIMYMEKCIHPQKCKKLKQPRTRKNNKRHNNPFEDILMPLR